MYRKIYLIFFTLSFLSGQIIMTKNNDYGSIILIGMVVPTILSYINIELIQWISIKKGNMITFQFNMVQFIIKSCYMCALTFIGVKVLYLNFKIFVPVLCSTWFFFHMVEAFFTNSIIKKSIGN